MASIASTPRGWKEKKEELSTRLAPLKRSPFFLQFSKFGSIFQNQVSRDFQNDNDFCCVAFRHKPGEKDGEKIGFMKYVHRLTDYAKYLDRQNVDWYYFNVYSRRSRQFIKRYYHDAEIPSRPPQ